MEMSITRALSELKLLEKRIEKSIREAQFVESVVGKKSIAGYSTVEEYEKKANATYQSILDLIKRRKEIKSKIVKSNAITNVKVAGKEMTVAEAIERKSSIENEEKLLAKLKQDFATKKNQVERENINMNNRLDSLIEKNFGTEGKKDELQYELIAKPFRESNEAKLINPLNIVEKIEDLETDIDTFIQEVDVVLSEANARTSITIED